MMMREAVQSFGKSLYDLSQEETAKLRTLVALEILDPTPRLF
jgi:hypothetical protein